MTYLPNPPVPVATGSTPGGIRPDGQTLAVDPRTGVLSIIGITPAPGVNPITPETILLCADGTTVTIAQLQGVAGWTGSGTLPGMTLAIPSNVATNFSYTATATLANYATAPSFTVLLDGTSIGAPLAGSTITTTSASLNLPAITAAGWHSLQLKDGNGVLSNPVYFQVLAETITVANPGPQVINVGFSVTGTYTGAPSALDYSTNGGSTWTAASSPTISGGDYSFPLTLTAANASQTLEVRDHANQAVMGTSGAFAVTTTPQEMLTVATPLAQQAGAAFTLTGTYRNATPSALDYSTNGGSTWVAATSPTISGGNYSFSATVPAANPSATIEVRDHANQSVTAVSGTFAVTSLNSLTFTGPAGAPTGILAMSPCDASAPGNGMLDGAGNLTINTDHYGLFESLGSRVPGSVTVTMGPSQTFLDIGIVFCAQPYPTALTLYKASFDSVHNVCQFFKISAGTVAQIGGNITIGSALSGAVSTIAVGYANGLVEFYINGTAIGSCGTDASPLAAGYVGLASSTGAAANKVATLAVT